MRSAARVMPSEGWQSLDIRHREQRLPAISGVAPDGTPVNTAAYRGRKAMVVAFLHGPRCAACRVLLELWGREAAAYEALEAVVVAVVSEWPQEDVPPVVTVVDPAGHHKRRLRERLPVLQDDGVAVVVLDPYGAAWAVWQAAEPEVPAVHEGALEWLRFLALQCPE